MARFSRFGFVAVDGGSMEPTYAAGDWLLVRWGARAQVGHVVVVERESYPGVFFIKRLVRMDQQGCWVEGDNKNSSTDSRSWGLLNSGEVVGKVLLRYRKAR